MNSRTASFAALMIAASLISAGCSEKNPAQSGPPVLEGDRPNTVILNFVDQANTTDTVRATWQDLDGDGGASPVVDTVKLVAGKSYAGTLIARLVKHSPDTTLEFDPTYRRLAKEHQFFYEAKEGAAGRIAFTINDKDSSGLPLGLDFTTAVSAGAPAAGTINVVLGHFDEAPKDGVTRSPESDIDANFPVQVR